MSVLEGILRNEKVAQEPSKHRLATKADLEWVSMSNLALRLLPPSGHVCPVDGEARVASTANTTNAS